MKVIYFYHNGKCGGTYCHNLLKKLSKVSKGKFVKFMNLTHDKKKPELDEKIKSFFDEIKDYSKEMTLLIHHHHGYPGMVELYDQLIKLREDLKKEGDELIMFTTVRSPMSYLISKLNYDNQYGSNLTFKMYIEEEVHHNHMSRYLLYNHMDRWKKDKPEVSVELVKKHLALFDYVFPIKGIPYIEEILNKFLGQRGVRPRKKINVGKKISFPTEEEKQKLIELNRIDEFLYNYANKQFEKHKEYMDSQKPTQSKIVMFFDKFLKNLID